jgi:hemerythrin-like domain-containing protein
MCSYCGCRSIDLIGRLTDEHEQIMNATSALRAAEAGEDAAAAAIAAKEVAALLQPHASLEERGLFMELRRDELFTEHVDMLCAEHVTIDAEVDAIVAGDLSRIPVLVAMLQDHIDKEEIGLFPVAAQTLTGAQWDRLHSPEMLDPEAVHPHSHTHETIPRPETG